MATVNYYVDTVSGDNANDGTSGNPVANLEELTSDSTVRANSGNDVIINCTGSTKDTSTLGNFINSGFVCDSLTIIGDGADADGFDSGKYTLSITNDEAIYIRDISANFEVKDIQLESISTGTSSAIAIRTTSIPTGSFTQKATNVRILHNNGSSSGTQAGVLVSDSDTNFTANNVIVDFIGAGSATTKAFDRASGTAAFYNCLAHNADVGYEGVITAKNCVAAGCVDAYDGSGTYTTCAGDQSGDTGVTQVTVWTDEFTNFASKDFTLKNSSPTLKDGGTDVSSENGGVSDDIDGVARSGSWDIGPSEEATAAITITGPDTCTAEAATQFTGTLLNTATTVGLRTSDLTYTKASTIDAQAATTLDADALTGWAECTPTTDVSGIPLEPNITSAGITSYQAQVYIGDGATTSSRSITVNPPSGYNVVQTMVSDANTTAGEGAFDPAIIAVENNMQAVTPTTVSGATLNINSKGEFTVLEGQVSAGQVLEFDVQYFSPSTGQWSEVNHSWSVPGSSETPSDIANIRVVVQSMIEDLVDDIFHMIGE